MSKLHTPSSATSSSVLAPSFPALESETSAPGDESDRAAPKPGKHPRSVALTDGSSSTTTTDEGTAATTRSLRGL